MAQQLSDALLASERREEWLACMGDVIEQEVSRLTGVQGASVRLGYRTLQRARPDAVHHVLNECWTDWVAVFASLCDDAPPGGLADAFDTHKEALTEGMLRVVDRRAAKTGAPVLERLYRSLRGRAREHVGRALPSVALAIEQRRGDR